MTTCKHRTANESSGSVNEKRWKWERKQLLIKTGFWPFYYTCFKCFSCWLLSQKCNLLNCAHKPVFLPYISTKINWAWKHFVFYFSFSSSSPSVLDTSFEYNFQQSKNISNRSNCSTEIKSWLAVRGSCLCTQCNRVSEGLRKIFCACRYYSIFK